ncbi:MAG: hypothetical protein OXG46_12555 [Chloroflexi bacterium]|nr:hypothetical protein [Chloroflexota bacterium]MCY3938525.1 hypothetical protein [Chloroflexota bacterium]
MTDIKIVGDTHPLIDLAAAELGRYVGLAPAAPEDAPDFVLQHGLSDIHLQGYVISIEGTVVTIAAAQPIGVLYGVYGYLEEVGFGFYLGGDTYPDPDGFHWKPVNVRAEPVFDIRGSLVWPNFLNSPATWDLADYQVFFDQMVKMRNNIVHVPAYGTPLEAYPPDGSATYFLDSARRRHYADETAWRGGDPFATSLTYGWGTPGRRWGRISGFRCEEFGFGTGDWFDTEVFGSRATVEGETREEQIIGAQETFAQALEYAGKRGLQIALGMEVEGNPFDPEGDSALNSRLKHILSTYPTLDYLAIWQAEMRSWIGPGPGEVDEWMQSAEFKHEHDRIASHFDYLGRPDLIAEAVRLSAYVNRIHNIVSELRPGLRLLVCGWGGDHWMLSTDLYLGLDKTVPIDVIFSSLDNIDPSAARSVSEVYGKLSDGRESWPVPWFESDAGGSRRDQWGPQPNTHIFADLCRDAREKGCEGFMGIHWRTRDLEEVFAYSARYAWDSDITFETFYDDYARRAYGERHGAEMAAILRELEHMGPRWTGSWGQWECWNFAWLSVGSPMSISDGHDAAPDSRPSPANLSRLTEIRGRLSTLLAESESARDPAGQERLRWLILTIDWLVLYDRVTLTLEGGGPYHRQADALFLRDALGDPDHSLDRRIWELLREAPLQQAMHAYARKIESKGELGVLAAINVKAFSTYEDSSWAFGIHRGNWPPNGVRGHGSDISAVIEWEPLASAQAYRVWRREFGSEDWTCVTPEPITALGLDDSPRSPGDYEYAVTTVAPPRLESMKSFGAMVRVGPGSSPPLIQVLAPPTVLWSDDRLAVKAIVTGERTITSVRLKLRTGHTRELPSLELKKGRGATFSIEVPLAELGGSSLQFGIEAVDVNDSMGVWPTGFPQVWRSLNVVA